ncbi:NnrU family protein [Labrenzia sp. 011]|uniref:NnrU family protein n=1 Tax=Labrenzia sp. 011 TaxID=2171494 RepID=UPI000D50C410|nr:NnrU family protein [Labrenzia sp. 011]PVB63375.1 NnrU family protein [Labrenzia sp. 011]
MVLLVAGLILFLGIHLLPTAPSLRAAFVSKLGEIGYKGLFSVISAVGFVLIVYGYGSARFDGSPLIYDPPVWMRHITLLLMIPAFIFLVAAYVPCAIRARLKHPMLVAVKTWAFTHLLANGDLASVVLFGSFLAWAVFDRISLKRRGPGAGQLEFVAGKPRKWSDAAVILAGLVLYGLFVWKLHALLIGVSVT